MLVQSVGIKKYNCPVSLRTKAGDRQQTIAELDLQADIGHDRQSSCVAVLKSILRTYRNDMHSGVFPELLARVRQALSAERARLAMRFPYFITKEAPVSKTKSLMEYQCTFRGTSQKKGAGEQLMLTVEVPVTTLCPCSKEISEAGAHNQRAEVTLQVQPSCFIWLEDLIRLVEECSSCELFSLLKRPDEKYVTEAAYANPMFVEDVARMIASRASKHPGINWFSVGVESFESIHKHSAYALVDSDDQLD
ncbi:MAG: GTP cyclohydrolase I FolE2 [Desulfobulbus propionicus]|nr:MAG: GTP cyclohydrolase I FolE2 [Desulfobulbus propionicus]